MSSNKGKSQRDRTGPHASLGEQRQAAFKEEMSRDRLARETKTARLRALRLAKEAADRDLAAKAPPKAVKSAAKRRPRKAPPPK